MSRLGAKTYSRKPECRSTVQFDQLLVEKGNKPSTAKVSVAAIHRWGMTSYTSLRKSRMNGQKEISVESPEPTKRIRVDSPSEDTFSFVPEIPIETVVEDRPPKPRVNKFFKSGSRAAKNADFDAVRLSVPPFKNNAESVKQASPVECVKKTNYPVESVAKVEFPIKKTSIPVEESWSSFVTSNSPNIVNLRQPSPLPLISHSTSPSIHYISPRKQDSASNAFDQMFAADLSTRSRVNTWHPSADISLKTAVIDNWQQSQSIIDNWQQSEPIISSWQQSQPMDYSKVEKVPEVPQKKVVSDFRKCNSPKVYESEKQEHTLSELVLTSKPATVKVEAVKKCDTEALKVTMETVPSPECFQEDSADRKLDFVNGTKTTSRPKKIFSSSLKEKHKARYNHRHWQSSSKVEEEASDSQGKVSLADEFDDDSSEGKFTSDLVSEVANTSFGDIRSYKCPKGSKEFYTVVKNVKQAYQCHESGETQEFNDDIEYLLECVQECNAIGTRCLSVLNLASKCMGPAFRIHLRAHGTMPKIFSALEDAPTDQNLSLCTATLMFVLSQDRLTMDIEASTLSLMLQLLETDLGTDPEAEIDLILRDPALCAMQDKHRERVNELCKEMQLKGHAKHLKLDNLNTGILAMETLLSLTSRKAGEWFKEEMRTLRGLDRIAETVTSSIELLLPEEDEISIHPTDAHFDKLKKIDRCLRVLENVTHMNAENQEYLMKYKGSILISSSLDLLKLCKSHFLKQSPIEIDGTIDESSQKSNKDDSPLLSCVLNLLKILSNITYRIALDDSRFPSSEGLMDHVLLLILQVPRAVAFEKRFDLLVLSLGLLMNLVENCPSNSTKFIEMYAMGSFDSVNDGYEMPATEALIELMLSRLEAARVSEEQADELLSSQEEKQAQLIAKKDVEAAADDLEETLMKTLQKAGKHMEHSIIAAYIAILLGCVAQKNSDFIDVMRDYVPDGKFDVMVEVLKKFKSFVNLTGSIGNRELASIQKVVQLLESS